MCIPGDDCSSSTLLNSLPKKCFGHRRWRWWSALGNFSSQLCGNICEIDQLVIDVCEDFFPSLYVGFDDPRVRLHIDNAAEFIKKVPEGNMMLLLLIHQTQ